MSAKNGKSLHIVMFPWLAFGHIIPYLDLSKAIAQKGHKISFISSPRNIDRLPKLPPNLASSISFVKIPLPKLAELPENAEATTDLIHASQMDYLKKAFDGMEPGLTRFLEEARPDWIVYDFLPHWLPPITARLGISGAFFFIINAWLLSFYGPTDAMISGSDYRSEPEDFMVPPKWVNFDTKVAYRRFEANWILGSVHDTDSGYSDSYRGGKIIAGTEALVIRHCREFEPEWLDLLGELHRTRIIPIGLMPPQDGGGGVEVDEGWISIRSWLDVRDKGSVVYVALGSEVTPSEDQLSELAHGLELSGVPFIWVLRKATECELPEGFEERVRSRGMVWRRWAPQLKILSHDSVGGFLTHCGWSSIVEGLTFGRPLVTLPFLVDQGLNSRVVVEKGIGVEVPRNEDDGSYTSNSVADSVKLVMIHNDGQKLRERAKEMGALFSDRALHDGYINNFINFLQDHRATS
ncbi:hypothetical protein C2S52_009455 [Perilla frutescens var. hirtella]|nr:hypothetical protein C2S51_017057 [Perilla frutescens var. frutescens]KAH6784496.1 hypothetical protein C2S52_009455 [Perilla frutescens var. hirtella]